MAEVSRTQCSLSTQNELADMFSIEQQDGISVSSLSNRRWRRNYRVLVDAETCSMQGWVESANCRGVCSKELGRKGTTNKALIGRGASPSCLLRAAEYYQRSARIPIAMTLLQYHGALTKLPFTLPLRSLDRLRPCSILIFTHSSIDHTHLPVPTYTFTSLNHCVLILN